jgi:hypothetical protein
MTKDEALKMAIEALNKLARLGNGDSYGNSDGNCIAIKTLKAIEEALEQPAKLTRLDVIDNNGRAYVNMAIDKLEFSYQDDGKTLKIFTNGAGVLKNHG